MVSFGAGAVYCFDSCGTGARKSKSPPFDKLRAGFLAQRAREKWGTRPPKSKSPPSREVREKGGAPPDLFYLIVDPHLGEDVGVVEGGLFQAVVSSGGAAVAGGA